MGWPKIEPEECQELIESMPRRVDAVIKLRKVIQSTRKTRYLIQKG